MNHKSWYQITRILMGFIIGNVFYMLLIARPMGGVRTRLVLLESDRNHFEIACAYLFCYKLDQIWHRFSIKKSICRHFFSLNRIWTSSLIMSQHVRYDLDTPKNAHLLASGHAHAHTHILTHTHVHTFIRAVGVECHGCACTCREDLVQ